jgi:lipoate-protein ligase A
MRERVTSVRDHADASREEMVRTLEDGLAEWVDAEEGAWTDDELARAQERAAAKYATDAWTRERTDPSG